MGLPSAKSLMSVIAIVGIAIVSYQWGPFFQSEKIVLHYFDARWTTETIRLLLIYGGINFEDNRVKGADWSELKPTMPFGHLPVIEREGKKAAQSIAIARYVAKMVKLTGDDDWEDLEIDAVVDTLSDIKEKLSDIFNEKNEENKRKLREKHVTETLPYYFEKLERMAKENEGHLVGKKLTWADFYFTTAYDVYTSLVEVEILEHYPNLAKVRKNVLELPAVKKWVETRPITHY